MKKLLLFTLLLFACTGEPQQEYKDCFYKRDTIINLRPEYAGLDSIYVIHHYKWHTGEEFRYLNKVSVHDSICIIYCDKISGRVVIY